LVFPSGSVRNITNLIYASEAMAQAAVRPLLIERRTARRMVSPPKATAARDASDPSSLRRTSREDLVNLAVGHPGELPSEVMASALVDTAERLRDAGVEGDSARQELNYVARWGSPTTLDAVASFLTEQYMFGAEPSTSEEKTMREVKPESLMITNGVSHGIDLACAQLTQPGDVVVVELPTYFLAADVFKDNGLRVVGLDGTAQGTGDDGKPDGSPGYFDVGALERALEDGLRPRLVYLVPTHSNPRGGTLPTRDRTRLVELAVRYDFFVVADEVYHLLHWNETPPPPRMCEVERTVFADKGLYGWDEEGAKKGKAAAAWEVRRSDDVYTDEIQSNVTSPEAVSSARVVSVSSFTKILAPGLRVGWIEAARSIVDQVSDRGYVNSGGCVAPFAASIVVSAIENGSQVEWLRRLRDGYRETSRALHDAAVKEAASTGWKVSSSPPSGGYFLWLELPERCDESAVLKAAEDAGVAYLPGGRCVPLGCESRDGARVDRSCRLCFAYLDEEKIVEGVRRLATAVRASKEG
jgi:DNA-binding transcriptional MocR family regulator